MLEVADELTFDEITLIPRGYKKRDPRGLLYLYPTSINLVAFSKQMQTFSFYQTLEVAETIAKRQGYILLPFSCIHWQRAKSYGADRKVKIGRKSFFMMRMDELTKSERIKLADYLDDIHIYGEEQ